MKAHRRGRLAAAALAAALVLGACGGSDDSASGQKKDEQAAAAADASPAGLTQETFAEKVAAAQAEAGTSHMTMTVDAAGQKVTAEGDVRIGESPQDTAASLTMDTGELGSMDLVLVDQVMYLNLGELTGGTFTKIDLTDRNSPLAAQYGSLLDQMDPSASIEQLRSALSGFEKSGDPEQIDGVEAQPYRLTVDTTELADAAGQQLGGLPETLEYTMWVGPDDLVRRMTSTSVGTVTIDYTKWGEDVSIEAPAAGQISDEDPFASMS